MSTISPVRTAPSSSSDRSHNVDFDFYHRIESLPTTVVFKMVRPPETVEQGPDDFAWSLERVRGYTTAKFQDELVYYQKWAYYTLEAQSGDIAVGMHEGRTYELHLLRTKDPRRAEYEPRVRWVLEDDQRSTAEGAAGRVYAIADFQSATRLPHPQLAMLDKVLQAHRAGRSQTFLLDVPIPSGATVRNVSFTLPGARYRWGPGDVFWGEPFGGSSTIHTVLGTRLDPSSYSFSAERVHHSPLETFLEYEGILSWYAQISRPDIEG